MADNLVSLSSMVCNKLDSNAGAFWNNAGLKQFHRRFKEVHSLLRNVSSSRRFDFDRDVVRNSWFSDVEGLISEVDDLVDAGVQSEISRLKFDHQLRRIDGRLAPLLNSLCQVAAAAGAGHDEDDTISTWRVNSGRSEPAVSERDIESSVSTVAEVLLRNTNMVLVLLAVGSSGTWNTALARGLFADEKVKSQFPLRFQFSVGDNIDLSRVLNAIAAQCGAEKVCERLLIVLDDVCDMNDEKLENFKSSISNLHHLRPCVLVTTRSGWVETMIRTVPARHLTYFPETNKWSDFNNELPSSLRTHSFRLGHGKEIGLEEATQSVKRHSTSEVKDEMSGHVEALSKNLPTLYKEAEYDASHAESATDEGMTCTLLIDKLAVYESKIQLRYLEIGGRLASHVTKYANSDAPTYQIKFEGDAFRIHLMECEDDTFQNKRNVGRIL